MPLPPSPLTKYKKQSLGTSLGIVYSHFLLYYKTSRFKPRLELCFWIVWAGDILVIVLHQLGIEFFKTTIASFYLLSTYLLYIRHCGRDFLYLICLTTPQHSYFSHFISILSWKIALLTQESVQVGSSRSMIWTQVSFIQRLFLVVTWLCDTSPSFPILCSASEYQVFIFNQNCLLYALWESNERAHG